MKKHFNPLKNPLGIKSLFIPQRGKRRTLRAIFRIGLLLLALMFIGLALTFAWFSKDLPGPDRIASMEVPQTTQIMDRNGTVLYEAHGDEKRTIVNASDIPKVMKDATIAAEDKNFYKHHGVSISGILRAAYADITKKRFLKAALLLLSNMSKTRFRRLAQNEHSAGKLRN